MTVGAGSGCGRRGEPMAIHEQSVTETLLRQLYELSCTPFRLVSFRERWESFGWRYRPGVGDEFGFPVQISGGWALSIDPLGGEVLGATLPCYYWGDYDQESHADPEEYRRQRQAYDDAFATAAGLARRVLPPPARFWTDADEAAHKAIVWEGQHGLLILQQACFDPQFGVELDFWLAACSGEEFHPTTPLIDWLCRRSQGLHAERDFPPLRW